MLGTFFVIRISTEKAPRVQELSYQLHNVTAHCGFSYHYKEPE